MINGLPEWARRYIHDIETYEPSGATSAAALAARYAAGVVHGAEVERRGWRGRAEEAEIGLCAHSQNSVPTDAVSGWLQYIKGTRAASPSAPAAAEAPGGAGAREVGCGCDREEGDSECFIHGADECGACGAPWARMSPG